jgi:type VI secretion system protein ImpK
MKDKPPFSPTMPNNGYGNAPNNADAWLLDNNPPPAGRSVHPQLEHFDDEVTIIQGAPQAQLPAWAPAPLRTKSIEPRTLCDALAQGFCMLFLLRSRHAPKSLEHLRNTFTSVLIEFERSASKLGAYALDISLCKYLFCVTADEFILRSQFAVRQVWQGQPLQLQYFKDQRGGERFFERLEQARQHGAHNLQVLEVFYMCLTLGFKGQHAASPEKLHYITATLGHEITLHKGGKKPFAPHAMTPDNIVNTLKTRTPTWVMGAVFASFAALAFGTMSWRLSTHTDKQMAAYSHVVKMPPRLANVKITLP